MDLLQIVRLLILVVCTLSVGAARSNAQTATAPADRLVKFSRQGKVVPLELLGQRKITLDGDLSEWSDMAAAGGILEEQLCETDASGDHARGDAAAFRIARDDQALYVAICVLDDSMVARTPCWEGDAAELYVDVRPYRGDGPNMGDSKYSPGVWEINIVPPRQDSEKARWNLGTNAGPLGTIDVAGKRTADGYWLEARLPFKSLGVPPERFDSPIGIDVAINDIDRVQGKGLLGKVHYAFSGSTHGWKDASGLAIADPNAKPQTSRAFPVKFQSVPGQRYLSGGVWVRGKIDASEPPLMKVGCTFEPAAGQASTQGSDLGEPQVTVTNYPSLGITSYRWRRVFRSVGAGKYTVTTHFAENLSAADAMYRFEAPTWKPTTGTWIAPEDMVVADTADGAGATRLPNGWRISPAGRALALPGDMPVKMLLCPDGKHLLVQTAGFNNPGVSVIDVKPGKEKVVQTVDLSRSWPGMTLDAKDGMVYVSAGTWLDQEPFTPLLPYRWDGKTLSPVNPPHLESLDPKKTWVSGILAFHDPKRQPALCLLDEQQGAMLLLKGKDLALQRRVEVGYHPFAVAVSPDGKRLAVSNWGSESISLVDLASGNQKQVLVGSHPNELAFANDGRLFVVCSGSNAVSVLDRRSERVVETIKTSLDPTAPVGSTPVALAISSNSKRLYVANADNNNVAVIDISQAGQSRILGFIPTGWYPSALAVSRDNKRLYIGVGKGMSHGPNAPDKYIGELLNGAISIVDLPDEKQLARYTQQVVRNTPEPRDRANLSSRDEQIRKEVFPKIKHVLFIIRENRTYDQVFGDISGGNGDSSLTMFGQEVTPNAHAMARRFVLFDNLYCSGEVSEDGHQWCNAAYVTDFTAKAWLASYSRGREPDADERLTASPAGYLWDNCRKHGKTYRSYGEFARFTSTPDSPPVFQGNKGLEGHASLAWNNMRGTRDYERVDAFIQELHEAERNDQWPEYMVMGLGEDHTAGARPGSFTPNACVASNDQALGKILEAVTHSKFWPETVIFVIEDDAQDGPDHVDAHRTAGLVLSPYTQHQAIDHTFYTTSSMVHTMELILGLPPMTQFDSAARPMFDAFDTTAQTEAYANLAPQVNLLAKNPMGGQDAEASLKLDLSDYDRADASAFNAILWHMWKPDVPMPAPVRSAIWQR